MTFNPSGHPKISRARNVYECKSLRCLLKDCKIEKGDIYVSVHDVNKNNQHFSVKYHIVCFKYGVRTDSSLISYDLENLNGYTINKNQINEMLDSFLNCQ